MVFIPHFSYPEQHSPVGCECSIGRWSCSYCAGSYQICAVYQIYEKAKEGSADSTINSPSTPQDNNLYSWATTHSPLICLT